jgi:polyisoprenyl-phosphate glycosyltransferase
MIASTTTAAMNHVAIVTPTFNDWQSLPRLLKELDVELHAKGLTGRVVVVDDGSTLGPDRTLCQGRYVSLEAVDLVRLRCNLGHQRAIAIGLTHLDKLGFAGRAVVVMDSDGEDRPEDIPKLLDQLSSSTDRYHVVFAARTKRFESLPFRVMYHLYRWVHWLLTGITVRVGNFSALSSSTVPRLLVAPDLWNHYAAAVFRSKVPVSTVPLPRGQRYFGQSHMRYSGLVAHGLSAIAVFGEIVGARLIIFLSGIVTVGVLLFGAVIVIRLFTDRAIAGWATNAAGLSIIASMQAMLLLLILALLVLGDRSHAKVIPLRDAEFFIESRELLWNRSQQ